MRWCPESALAMLSVRYAEGEMDGLSRLDSDQAHFPQHAAESSGSRVSRHVIAPLKVKAPHVGGPVSS